MADKLADPGLYEEARIHELEGWNRKFAEIEEAMIRAEGLWLEAQEKLDEAES